MNDFSLKCFLTSNLHLQEDELDAIIALCNTKNITKNTYLLREGDTQKIIYFVEKGLLKQYSIDAKGGEHILYFYPENWFVSNRESIWSNAPSPYYIKAIEDTTLKVLDETFLAMLAEKFPTFHNFNTHFLQNQISQLQQRVNQLLGASAEERYLNFVKVYPDILLRVPLIMIAAYIGITPESLSRIRRDVALR